LITELEQTLRSVFYSKGEIYITLEDLKSQLKNKQLLLNQHQSIFG
jgi:phosphoenolpyruvate carboxylase